MSNKLLWTVIIGVIIFLVLPFPLNFIASIVIGAAMPWIGDSKQDNKKNTGR